MSQGKNLEYLSFQSLKPNPPHPHLPIARIKYHLLTFGWVVTTIRHEREIGTRVDNSNVRGAQVRIVIDHEQYQQRAQTGAGTTPHTWRGLECIAYCSHYGRGLPNCHRFTSVYCYLPTQPSDCR